MRMYTGGEGGEGVLYSVQVRTGGGGWGGGRNLGFLLHTYFMDGP